MHPVKPDASYMRAVMAAAADYHVDSFEICGDAHSSTGGLEGAIRFRDYPEAAAMLDFAETGATIAALNEVVGLARQSGRPVYYWHREVMVPPEVVATVRGLLDADGEFDLLGAAYHELLRSKIREFFDHVPDMDGLVLTLTESNYSVIHNSNQERYSPPLVIEKIITTFAEELEQLGKRFILRSFGSIGRDYEDILAGVERVDARHKLEIETKITPYDFSPFLPMNGYLRRSGHAALSAEYDSIGEFLGAGYLPAADPERVIECVRHARAAGASRHVIRVDRIGHATFEGPQAVNLLAFDRAIRDADATAEEIWKEWSARRWQSCGMEMTHIMRQGIEMVKKTHFIAGCVIFHAFPIDPALKWIKASGILSLFKPGFDLARHIGMWGIKTEGTAPSREALLVEKAMAVELAEKNLAALGTLRESLPSGEYEIARTAWGNAVVVTRLVYQWSRCVCAYFNDMDDLVQGSPSLAAEISEARACFEQVLGGAALVEAGKASESHVVHRHEYSNDASQDDCIEAAYAAPLWRIIQLLRMEYDAELAERMRWRAMPGIVDYIVCGGVGDDWRVRRYMHASHARLEGGRVSRAAGNRVFPNGFIECELALPPGGRARLRVEGDKTKSAGLSLAIDGGPAVAVAYDENGRFECELAPASGHSSAEQQGLVTIRLQKSGADYPWIYGIGTLTVS
ncbi:hypothetical protein OH491_06475 [Termitidicoccus mucosus]|uniref:Uncharacterized protein n=1 Tax=Termitidicoccus mucosus TaxID=1184151 RepID=A0A178IGE5_9BACT|nr:hypothetical protein AW736_18505 [Opitutaceae bacterium TSB47]